ncbi:hypothetical protein VC60_gp49 [Mycobacterium phage Sbash]|uniref:Uncharacterized protein n=1 Tax=Mycobacterium phage Sbash TaxID=1567475 RepID=A0A0A7RVN4_9CAUD|nr:hypothetical protein VC60_gp49 [Mycobacterium phage Sbash]AJA43350.1 hypothetical protein PBI_SBASH_49 [Mycobacterium phage Sbash]
MIAGALRYAADFLDAVQQAYAERRAGFLEREAGDYLDASGITDATVPDPRYMTLREFLATATDAERAEMAAQRDRVYAIPDSDEVVDVEVHCTDCQCPTTCRCGRELYAEYDGPGAPPIWFHRDDDSPIGVECGHYIARIGEDVTCRCGEIFGDGYSHAKHLVDLQRASRSVVRPEYLATHIAAIRTTCERNGWAEVDQAIAADLLSDYHITRKK